MYMEDRIPYKYHNELYLALKDISQDIEFEVTSIDKEMVYHTPNLLITINVEVAEHESS